MQIIGQPFIELDSVDSTNNYAMAQVQTGNALPGTAWFAHSQTAGKGQRGKTWNSQPGDNIITSIAIQPALLGLDLSRQFYLSIAVALGCHDFFSTHAGDETSIKWPNDIYWRDRKAGGILIENLLQGLNWQYAIAGIGININQVGFPEAVKNPVSLRQITGKVFSSVELVKELYGCLQGRMEQVKEGKLEDLLKRYNEVLFKKDMLVRLKKGNMVFETTVMGVLASGELWTEDVMERRFGWGEVEWVL